LHHYTTPIFPISRVQFMGVIIVCPTTPPASLEKQEYCKQRQQLHEENEKIRKIINKHGGSIAGMPLLQFQNLLNFLQNKINTYLLCYETCFGGGAHLNIPYLMLGFPELYSFIIINTALTEAPIGIPKLFQIPLIPNNIKITPNKKVTFNITPYGDFTNFFHDLNQEKIGIGLTKNFKTIIGYIKPIRPEIGQLPLIRYPKTDRFFPIDFSNKIKLLNRITISVEAKQGESIIQNKELALIYLQYIPIPIKIPANSNFPSIISMIPNTQNHFIKKIEAPHIEFTKIIKGFFNPPKLATRKRFFIETINCINDLDPAQSASIMAMTGKSLTLKNLIIDYNPPRKGIKMTIAFENRDKLFNILISEHIPQTPPTKVPPELITIGNKNYIITIKPPREALLKEHRDFFAKAHTTLYKSSQWPKRKLFEIPQIPIQKTRK